MLTPYQIVKQKKAEAISRIMNRGYAKVKRVYIGAATCEIAAGSKEVMNVFKKAGLENVYISQKGCAGRCNLEPTVEIIEEGRKPTTYIKVDAARAKEIIRKHIKNGEIVKEWTTNE